MGEVREQPFGLRIASAWPTPLAPVSVGIS